MRIPAPPAPLSSRFFFLRRWVLGVALAAAIPAAALADEVAVPWLSTRETASPVARIFDAFMVTSGGIAQAGGLRTELHLGPDGDIPEAMRWTVAAAPGESAPARPWAYISSYLPAEVADKIAGIRVSIQAERAGVLAGQFCGNTRGGFWKAVRIGGEQTRTFEAGVSDLDFRLDAGKLPAAQRARISGFRLLTHAAPFAVTIREVSLVFADAKAAAAYRAAKHRHDGVKFDTMTTWLRQRGVSTGRQGKDIRTVADAKVLWQAAQVIAEGEQLDYWLSLARHAQVSPALIDRGEALKKEREAFASGTVSAGQIGALQTRVDGWIDDTMAAIPAGGRRWSRDENARFFTRPDGERYRMFGPFFFRSIYNPTGGRDVLWRPWDVRYLSALGFNGIRLVVVWKNLEPVRGQFDQPYVDMLKAIMREAERYGMGVSIDLHWPYPQWFIEGPDGMGPAKGDIHPHNSYHWPEAVAEVWGRLGETLKDVPNIVAFEVPTNETNMGTGPRGLEAYPTLVKAWNDWLRKTYGTREALAAAWSSDVPGRTYGLQPDENWDNDTIRPLGYQGDPDPEAAYAHNPRFWDHLRWAVSMQENMTGRIMEELRKAIPDAEGMMQYSIGDVWDRSPVPVNYKSIATLYGPHVLPGTHYGMGGTAARKAASLTFKSYDSEQQMEGRSAQVQRHVELGLGFCPFSFHARGGGGMLLSDDEWYLKPEVAYLPRMASWIRTYWPDRDNPEAAGRPHVAYIENTRLAGASMETAGDIIPLLEKNGVATGIFEGLRIVKEPSLLDGYEAVVLDGTLADRDLIGTLRKHYHGRVLLYGGLARDAFAHGGAQSIAAELAGLGVLFTPQAPDRMISPAMDFIDLEGQWDWKFTGLKTADPAQPPADDGKWGTMRVPGFWGEGEILGSLRYRRGDAWYRKTVEIPKAWTGRALSLKIGAIDDFDWVFFNGTLIGKTGQERANWWLAPRDYPIPPALIRWGGKNELYICVRNDADDGGITKAPVRIAGTGALQVAWAGAGGAGDALRVGSWATFFGEGSVRPGAQVLASVVPAGGGAGRAPALVRDGNWFWWIGDTAWTEGDAADEAVVRRFLAPEGAPR